MPDIAIHRCRLRVIRRSGWSWGSSQRRIAEKAVRLLPALIDKSLPGIFEEDQDSEYSSAIELQLRIGIRDLQDGLNSSVRKRSGDTEEVHSELLKKFDIALRAALGIPFNSIGEPSPTGRVPSARSQKQGTVAGSQSGKRAVETLLMRWMEDGVFELEISRLSAPELTSWIAILRTASIPPFELSPDRVSFLKNELQAEVEVGGIQSRPETLASFRRQILAAARAAREFKIPIASRGIWRQIEHLTSPDSSNDPNEEIAQTYGAGTRQSKRWPAAPIESTQPSNSPHVTPDERVVSSLVLNSTWDAHICSALPFLVLAPLQRLDYFETLAATLQASGLTDFAPLFAVALARKSLPAPERGWRRDGAAEYASAVAAGLRNSVADESLEDFSRSFAAHLGPVARLLEDSVRDGHTIGTPVTLRRCAAPNIAGWLLMDAPGCFPIAFSPDLSQILTTITLMQHPLVLLDEESATAAVVHHLEQTQGEFLTNARPGRNETWQRVNRPPGETLWTNSANPDTQELRTAISAFTAAQAEAAALWTNFVVSRPSVPRATMPELEQLVSFSAAVSLGLIAWDLWHARGRTTPQLALERFADFDARVRFDSDRIIVRLPMGRRYSELREAGLLQPIDGIPWFSGRRVEFNGG